LQQLNLNIQFNYGGNVNYNPAPGRIPSLMTQQTVQALITVQPLRPLTMDNTYLLDREHSVANGADVYESQTFRTRINYQFTRSFSARAIVEYDSTLVNPAETSLQRHKQLGTQALLTWLPHPGTAIYVGYNNDLQNLDRSLCNRLPGGACDPVNTAVPRSFTLSERRAPDFYQSLLPFTLLNIDRSQFRPWQVPKRALSRNGILCIRR